MVGFGSSLRLARRPGWEEAYFDYEALKFLLTQIEAVYEEEAHLQQRRREGRDLDMMFVETPPGFGMSTGDKRPPPDARDYRDELFIESDSDAAFESLMKYDYYSAEEEASDLEQQQQHQLEMEQAAMMHPNGSPNNNNNVNTASIGSAAAHSIFNEREHHTNRSDIIATASSSSTTSAHPFSLGSSLTQTPNTNRYHDYHGYGAEGYPAYSYDEEDSQDGNNNICVPAAWGVGRNSNTKKTTRAPKSRIHYRGNPGMGRGSQFLSPSGDHSDFFVHHHQPVTDSFILDSSAQTADDEPYARQSAQDMDGLSTLTSFSQANPNNSILQKPFRRTESSEKTSLLSLPPSSTPSTGLFSFASQAGPITPPPRDTYASQSNRPPRSLQLPSMATLSASKSSTTSSFHLQNKAEMVKQLEEERKQDRRKRRQKRRQRAEKRKALEAKVPPHIRTAHTKAREITERFLGLLRAECEKVMLFAQSRLGELADTAGSLRFPSMEDHQQQQNQQTSSSSSHYHGPTAISSQHSEPPLSPRTQGSFDYPLSEGGCHSSASSTSDDGGGGLFYWSDSSSDSARSRESGSPNVARSLSAFRDIQREKNKRDQLLGDKHSQRVKLSKREEGRKHDGFNSAKRHLDHFAKLRRNRPIFQRSGNVMGEDLLLLSAVDEADGYAAVGVELMHVLRFICVNLIAVRKICRKHDRLLMNRMLGGYYHHLKMVAAAEANRKLSGSAIGPQTTQQAFRDEHVQNAQTLGGLLARESGDIFEPHHPAVIAQVHNYKLVGLYDGNLQQLANSRTVQVISSCLVLALSEYEVSRTRANALATLNSAGSGLPAPRRGSSSQAVLRHKQQDHMSSLTGADSQAPALMFPLEEADERGAIDSDLEDGGPPSTASSISLTRLRFTVTSIIALREAARRKKDMYSTYLSRSMLAFTGRTVIGEGLDGCSRETLDFFVSYNPDAALLMDPAALSGALNEGMWSKRSMCSVMASSLAVATTPVDLPHEISSKSLQQQEKVVIAAINVLPKVKFLEVPDLFKSQRNKKSRSPVATLEDDAFRSILRLNRSSHLLFTMNYYVVHPTTITFVTAVGSPSAHSALVIGAPSLAALMSALLHCYVLSGDRNDVRSLRWLFLLASLLGFAGNCVHVYGVCMECIPLAVLGRFIMGFSCSEILHRNIVASLLPHNRVVVETAILVQTQVLGLLSGLMIGTLAEFLPYHIKGWGIRSLSSASWLMALLWFGQLGFVCAFFKVEDGEAKERMEANNSAEVEQLLAKYKPAVAALNNDSDYSGSEELGKDSNSSVRRSPSIKLTYGATDENDHSTEHLAPEAVEATLKKKSKEKRKHHKKSRKRRMRTLKSFPNRLHKLLSYSVAAPLCLLIVLFIKFAQEVLFSSCPMILNRYFRWGGGRAGIFMSFLTLAILPLHFICGHISRKYEERTVIKKSLVILVVGLMVMVNYGSVIKLAFQLKDLLGKTEERQRETMYDWLLGTVQYFIGFGVTFLSLASLDSSTLSLLSKVSPPRIRSSSVALQLGTIVSFVSLFARVVADAQILMIGLSHRLINTDLINSLILPLLIAAFVLAHFVRKHFFFLM